MRTTSWAKKAGAVVMLAALGCGDSPEPRAEAPKTVEKPWVKVEATGDAMARAADARESMRFVLARGEVRVTAQVDGDAFVVRIPADLAAFRTANVHTLDYPIGYVRFDPLALDAGDPGWNAGLVDAGFRRLGSPIQLFYDSRSVGDLVGRLASDGAEATGTILGEIHVDDRQIEVALPARFQRKAGAGVTVTVENASLDLREVAYQSRLAAVAAAIGAKQVDPVVRLDVTLELARFEDDTKPLPTFVRTPVTVNTVGEVVSRFKEEAAANPVERMRTRMAAAGMPEGMYADLDDEQLQKLSQFVDDVARRRRGEDVDSMLENPPPAAAERGTPGTRVEGGVVIRD